jgi:TonB family protein
MVTKGVAARMETQAIPAPAEKLTREASKHRQVGYGLPCAKCHKYFPADLEVCPICKGRERVSPIVAPRLPKPVQSETSVAAPVAAKQEVKESPKLESLVRTPPIEIKVRVKEQLLDRKESITTSAVAEPSVETVASGVEPQEAAVSTSFESPVPTARIEIQGKDRFEQEPITPQAVAELPVAVESEPASATPELENGNELASKLEPAAVVAPAAIAVQSKDQFSSQASAAVSTIPEFPVVAAVQFSAETAPVIVAPVEAQHPAAEPVAIPALTEIETTATGPVAGPVATPVTTEIAESAKETESPLFANRAEASVKDLSFEQLQELIAIPAQADTQPSPAPVVESIATVVEEPPVLPASVPMLEEKEFKNQTESPTISAQIAVVEHRLDEVNPAEPIVITTLVEVSADDSTPTAVTPVGEEEEFPQESESAFTQPTQEIGEDHCLELLYPAEPIVTPAPAEAQAYEFTPDAAELEKPEPQKKEEVRGVSEVPTAPVEAKIVESPAAYKETTRHSGDEEFGGKVADALLAKPTDVSAPVVLHLNLGELRVSKAKQERAPIQPKEVEAKEAEISGASTSLDPPERPLAPSVRRFDLVTFALGVVVLACAVLLITLATLRLMPYGVFAQPVRRAKPAYSIAPATADQNTNSPLAIVPPATPAGNSESSNASPATTISMPSAPPSDPTANHLASSPRSERILTLAPGLAEGNLLHRVEPDYPEEARRQGVQGPVVMNLHIAKDGSVQNVDLVSGQSLLAQASIAAVKQWRFRTRYVNGEEVEMQTQITLHFALPTP